MTFHIFFYYFFGYFSGPKQTGTLTKKPVYGILNRRRYPDHLATGADVDNRRYPHLPRNSQTAGTVSITANGVRRNTGQPAAVRRTEPEPRGHRRGQRNNRLALQGLSLIHI